MRSASSGPALRTSRATRVPSANRAASALSHVQESSRAAGLAAVRAVFCEGVLLAGECEPRRLAGAEGPASKGRA